MCVYNVFILFHLLFILSWCTILIAIIFLRFYSIILFYQTVFIFIVDLGIFLKLILASAALEVVFKCAVRNKRD